MVQNSNDRSEDDNVEDGSERIRRRAESRRLSILRAAARVFRKQGFASTGMREIAAEAGLSPGNLYYYFAGKHELLYFCQDRWLDTMLGALERARLSGAPIAERVGDVLQAHVHCLLDELEGSAAHLEVDALPPELRQVIVEKRDRYERGVRGLVRTGIDQGHFADCDAGLVTRAMLGAANWTAHWFRREGPQTVGEVAESTADFLVRGLTRDEVPRGKGRRAGTGGSV